MYLLNGEQKQCIDFSDRGFQYGDGLFETIEVLNGAPLFLDQHLQRLLGGCQRLFIPSPDTDILLKEARQLSAESKHAVLKLIMTRGSGGRGYRQPDSPQPTRLFSLHPFPDYPEHFKQNGVAIRFCQHILGINPSLAGIKHMNRLEQILARAEWDDLAFQEGLMMNNHQHIIEGTMSNLFIVKNKTLYTPLVDQCGVAGILRGIVIRLAKKNGISVIEKNILQTEVLAADEVFLSNSIIGIWPVKKIERQLFNIGLLTKKMQQLFLDFRQKEIEHVC